MAIGGACLTKRRQRVFQARAAATENARSPSDERRVEGMSYIRASAERRRRCVSVSAAR